MSASSRAADNGVGSAPGDPPRRPAVPLALLLLAGSGAACAATAPGAPEERPPGARAVSGFLSSRYRGRSGLGERDHDLYQVLSADWRGREPASASAHVLGELAWDLDGPDADGEFAFYSLQDTYGRRLTGRLLHAYLDLPGSPRFEVLRLGRQFFHDTPLGVTFDGARLETARAALLGARFGAYAGVPVHPYESSRSGDLVGGLLGLWELWKGALLRLDWMHLEDETRLRTAKNDLVGVDLQQALRGRERDALLEARWTGLEGAGRDVRLRATFFDSPLGWTLDASYYELLTTQNELAVPLDPFSSSLFELFPYRQVTLLASKSWTHLVLEGGADARRVADSDDVGEFNRDFLRGHLSATGDDLLPWDTSLTLTGEVWNADADDFRSWGVALAREFGDRVDVDFGSYYSLYKVDFFANEERDHVRTWFAGLSYDPRPSTRFSLDYQFEQNDLDDFHQLRVGCTWRF